MRDRLDRGGALRERDGALRLRACAAASGGRFSHSRRVIGRVPSIGNSIASALVLLLLVTMSRMVKGRWYRPSGPWYI